MLVAVILALLILVIDIQMTVLNRVKEQLAVILHPVQWVAMAPLRVFSASRDFLTQQTVLLQENRRLANRHLVMQAKLMRLDQLQVENHLLRGMLNLAKTQPMYSVLAEVSYRDYNAFSDKLMVNRGARSGIKPGQVVLDAYGLLGQVIRVLSDSSEIRLVTDKDYPVPVMVLRNELRAVIYGGVLPNTMEVRFLPFNSDIKVGDRLVTSGSDGVYPVGIPVATVQSIEANPGSMFAKIVSKPFAKPQEERFVLIVTAQPKVAGSMPVPDRQGAH
jgi:rod shape-determining protein MreC